MFHLATRLLSACIVAAVAGCAVDEPEELGTVDLNLVGQGPSGNVYVLRHAEITVISARGPFQVFRTDDQPDAAVIRADTVPGLYTLQLAPGWQLMRRTATGEVAVDAVLVSPNPDRFTVVANGRTAVALRFLVQGEVLALEHGSYDIVVEVDERVLRTVGRAVPLESDSYWSGGFLVAQRVALPVEARLRRIGYVAAASPAQPTCRFAVYGEMYGAPALVVAASEPVVVADGAHELNVADAPLGAGGYWLALFCDREVGLRAGAAPDVLTVYRDVLFEGGLPALFPSTYASSMGAPLNLYMVVEAP